MMKSWLIDTNVLIYSYDQTHNMHLPSYELIEYSIGSKISAVITHQNLLEFLAVVTNPKRVTHPLSLDQAFQKIVIYATSFPLINPLQKTFFTFANLISRYKSSRQRIFDFYLSATALDNGINQICTWNVKDFSNISELVVKTPEEVVAPLKNL